MSERVVIAPYDPTWPRRFEDERVVLEAVFAGTGAVIEHVGSTAVPGLAAKPVVDIMVGLATLAVAEARLFMLEAAGYEYAPQYEQQVPERRYFRRPRRGTRLVHLHCVVLHGSFWVHHLAFRDHLRSHPDTAAAYEALKRDLAARVPKADYTDAKSPFIEQVLRSALAAGPG